MGRTLRHHERFMSFSLENNSYHSRCQYESRNSHKIISQHEWSVSPWKNEKGRPQPIWFEKIQINGIPNVKRSSIAMFLGILCAYYRNNFNNVTASINCCFNIDDYCILHSYIGLFHQRWSYYADRILNDSFWLFRCHTYHRPIS